MFRMRPSLLNEANGVLAHIIISNWSSIELVIAALYNVLGFLFDN